MLGNIYAQISPGELSKAHADLEGISNCTKCHTLGKSLDNAKCLDCHKEIAGLINLNRGYHSNKKVKNENCWKCHGEHFGRNFQIIRFDENKFNHNEALYELAGKHKELECNKCHKKDFISDSKLKQKAKTFLGLTGECADCHEDVHRNTLGKDCASCHNEEKFKPAVKFNHDEAKFKLTGAHKNVGCEKCHAIENIDGKEFQRFTDIEFSSCNSCHTDVHKGKFGKKCASCHTTKSFTDVKNLKSFNHSKTAFPLIGKHKRVKCSSCHKGSLSFKPKFKYCYNCHSDFHDGEFENSGILRDCKECHNENGFSPSLFSMERHAELKFKLTGAHTAIPCTDCHYQGNKWKFRISGDNCIECHEDFHSSVRNSKFFTGINCESCHSTGSWQSVTFDHNKTKFELLGKHKEEKCESCHFKSEEGKIVQHFNDLGTNCSGCHEDIHAGQFNESDSETCKTCHTFDNWEPTLFDHNNTGFALEGAHAKVECNQCHYAVSKGKVQYILYKIERTRCIDCHS